MKVERGALFTIFVLAEEFILHLRSLELYIFFLVKAIGTSVLERTLEIIPAAINYCRMPNFGIFNYFGFFVQYVHIPKGLICKTLAIQEKVGKFWMKIHQVRLRNIIKYALH